jgi:hypothetical protein
VQIKAGYTLTRQDAEYLNYLLASAPADRLISVNPEANAEFRRAARIDSGGNKEIFAPTLRTRPQAYPAGAFAPVRSRLPYKSSLKLGAAGLKTHPIRLVFTILLSTIAFCMFGLADTLSAYNKVNAMLGSMTDTGIRQAVFVKETERDEGDYTRYDIAKMTDGDLQFLNETFSGYAFKSAFGNGFSISNSFKMPSNNYYYSYYQSSLGCFYELNGAEAARLDYELLAGKYPTEPHEIAISEYIYAHYRDNGFLLGSDASTLQTVAQYGDIVGKVLRHGTKEFTIAGIVDTRFKFERYERLKTPDKTAAMDMGDYMLADELRTVTEYGLHAAAFVMPGYYEDVYKGSASSLRDIPAGVSFFPKGTAIDEFGNTNAETLLYVSEAGAYSAALAADTVWIPGKTAPSGWEIVVSRFFLFELIHAEDPAFDFEHFKNTHGYADDDTAYRALLSNAEYTLSYHAEGEAAASAAVKVVGVYKGVPPSNPLGYEPSHFFFMADEAFNAVVNRGDFKFAVAPLTGDSARDKRLIDFSYETHGGVKYLLKNEVSSTLDSVNGMIEAMAAAFLYVGLVFAVFAALLLFNFISAAISQKMRDIGTLRAAGARGADVFGIFLNESLIIALFNFALAAAGCFVASTMINNLIRTQYGLLVTLLSFSIRQIAMILAVSVGVALLASAFPLFRIARKKPIDIIKDK